MEIPLTAYDVGIYEEGCGTSHALEFEGQLPQDAVTLGLQQALRELPVFAGRIKAQPDGTHVLCCPAPGSHTPLTTSSCISSGAGGSTAFHFSYQVKDKRPHQDSLSMLWTSGAMPPTRGLLSSVRVTYYKDCNRTLLIFVWNHAICDAEGAVAFLNVWLHSVAAALSAGPTKLHSGSALTTQTNTSSSSSSSAMGVWQFERLPYFSQPGPHSGWEFGKGTSVELAVPAAAGRGDGGLTRGSDSVSSLSAGCWGHTAKPKAAEAEADADAPDVAPQHDQQKKGARGSKQCRTGVDLSSCTAADISKAAAAQLAVSSCGATAATDNSHAVSSGSDTRVQYLEWLTSTECPFPWDPLDMWRRCAAYWRVTWVVLTQLCRHVVWHIPRDLVEGWKSEARTACPLPPGLHYSTTMVTAALLASGLYLAEQQKYEQEGGLIVNFVINCRGGRVGMSIPDNTISNPILWGARIWVPAPLLAAAGGRPSPELMYHLRTQLAAQLEEPHGVLNKQFAWLEAARCAGLTGKLYVGGQLLQCMDGEITLDALPTAADSLPELPGHTICYHMCRNVGICTPRFFLAQPAMVAANGSSADGEPVRSPSSIASSCGVRVESTLPGAVAARLAATWHGLGLQDLKAAAAQGTYRMEAGGTLWTVLESVLLPHTTILYSAFVLPLVLLWAACCQGLLQLTGRV